MVKTKKKQRKPVAVVLTYEGIVRQKFRDVSAAKRALKHACRVDKEAIIRARGKILRSCWDEGR